MVGVGEGQGAQGSLVQGTELQDLEDASQVGTVGTRDAQVVSGSDSQVQVDEQVVESTVAHDVVEVVS